MKYLKRLRIFLLIGFMILSGVTLQSQNLIWADEFNGTSLDLTKWEAQLGDGCSIGLCGWGNNEEQYYKAENAVVGSGVLKIIAKKERVGSKAYTSARIRTKGKADFTYGRLEARIKLPIGAGLWPAFWMLPTDEVYGSWPKSGEIDIMEYLGSGPDHAFGTIHYGDPYPNNKHQGDNFYLYNGSKFSDKFYEFAIEWKQNEIRWYIDNILYCVKTSNDVSPYNWPFNQRFHFILNTAIGGNLGGTVDPNIFPQTMEIDYVRVYDGPKPTISGKRVVTNKAQGEKYTLYNTGNASISWSVPAGATIVSGQGTSTVTVNFGDASGNVTATIGTQVLPIDVMVEPSYTKDFSFENFDENGSATFYSNDGTLTEVSNPAPNTVNGSAISGKYVRNSQIQYDVLFYTTSAIPDASLYAKVAAPKKFYMDVYTSAPIGTEIMVQLETSTATASNYPTGRHSRYTAKVAENGRWHRLAFSLLDKPDAAASATISKIAVLFNSNTYTGDTYYFDNFDSYNASTGGGTGETATSIHVESVVTGTKSAGASKYGIATITIYDNLGKPASGALVTGNFSGSFNETASGTTDATGKVTLQTKTTAKGTVIVNYCVTNVSGSLPYNPSQNKVACTQSGAISTEITDKINSSVSLYPIPVKDELKVQVEGFENKASITVYNLSGKVVLKSSVQNNLLDVRFLPTGVYMLEVKDSNNLMKKMFVK